MLVYFLHHFALLLAGELRPPAADRGVSQTGRSMLEWQVIVDVTVASEVAAFSHWLERWRGQLSVSENEGCGCCVDIWTMKGPAEAKAELPAALLGATP